MKHGTLYRVVSEVCRHVTDGDASLREQVTRGREGGQQRQDPPRLFELGRRVCARNGDVKRCRDREGECKEGLNGWGFAVGNLVGCEVNGRGCRRSSHVTGAAARILVYCYSMVTAEGRGCLSTVAR